MPPDLGVHARKVVVDLFEAARETPGEPYEPERFLAYLTSPPPKGRRVADTFRGRRRLVRFMESVQMELGVCFTNADWEHGFALEEFVQLLVEKANNPAQAHRLAQRRLREARMQLAGEPLKWAILGAPLIVVAFVVGSAVQRMLLALLWTAIVGGVAALVVREYRYASRLATQTARLASRQL